MNRVLHEVVGILLSVESWRVWYQLSKCLSMSSTVADSVKLVVILSLILSLKLFQSARLKSGRLGIGIWIGFLANVMTMGVWSLVVRGPSAIYCGMFCC